MSRDYIPIDKSFDGKQKDSNDAIERLKKERYANPVYELAQITDFVYRSEDPKDSNEIARKIIVQPFSFDESKKKGLNPPDFENEKVVPYDDITYLTIGVRRDAELSTVLKIGDLIEVEIVANEITKRNSIDGFYRSTIKETEGFFEFVEGKAFPLVEMFKETKNSLEKTFFPTGPDGEVKIPDEVLNTKRTVPSYRYGKMTGEIEIITLEGKEVEITTAKKYLEMKNAAMKEGVRLGITSGYRSMESQTSIYNRRYEPDYQGTGTCRRKGENTSGTFEKAKKVATKKGVAAYPGCSNHQNGKALDLWNSSKNVAWLRANAAKFGFKNTVRSENWHWEYIG